MLKKWIIILFAGMLVNGTGVALASPPSGYSQFMQSLDSIAAGAVMPIADEQQIAMRSAALPTSLSSQSAQIVAVAKEMLGQPVVGGGGIYIGKDKFIHTSFSKGIVAIADMNDRYFVQRYYGAKRVIL